MSNRLTLSNTHALIARLLACVVLALGVTAPASAQPAPSPLLDPGAPWRAGRSQALLALLDEFVENTLRNNPQSASTRGDERYNSLLDDVSPEATARELEQSRALLTKLEALDTPALSETDRTDADLLRYLLNRHIRLAPLHREQLPVDARSGPQVWLAQMHERFPMRTAEHRADFAARLEQVPRVIDQTIAQMRLGLAAGRVPPRVVMLGVDDQARALATQDIEETPSLSPFYAPFRATPNDPSSARARAAIKSGIVPAFRRFADFVRDEYLPKCRQSVGISQGVDGPAAYDQLLIDHTTTSLSAEEIHQIGVREVARIKAEMMLVIARSDFSNKDSLTGDELFRAFVAYLRTDKRFYFDTPEALLAGYREIAKRVDAEMPKLFRTLPRLPYGVREIPAIAAPSSPTAYYYSGSTKSGVAGYFMANTHLLDQRPRYEMIALTMHEAVPGHHHQITLAEELEGVHPFRTFAGFTAFVEGWALYAERLGLEVGGPGATPNSPGGTGLYADPYDDFGRLTYEMWRACRLVVDTGIHAKEWPRQRAIDFMLANTALSKHNIEREVDRYIAWPGQACAYKVGELKIRELRARAEKALGERFDLRAFHDELLGSGALPLPTLEARMDRWIAGQKR